MLGTLAGVVALALVVVVLVMNSLSSSLKNAVSLQL
jgi:hypothetical protein